MKCLTILGSTGSIGKQTLDVVDWFPEQFAVFALVAQKNYRLLAEQAIKYRPELVVIQDETYYQPLWEQLQEQGFQGKVICGQEGVIAAATAVKVDMVVAAISGLAGLLPVIEGIKAKKAIAFANKEVLVAAGHLVMDLVKEQQIDFLPVDSEHSALWQCMAGHRGIARLLLTCSGGPFKYKTQQELEKVNREMALAHPTWQMGPKITIDSATLMNKGLEIIEAHWLFDMPYEQIDVVIHPESIIHSMVQYQDGAFLAHLGKPDMRIPIQYALTYPERWQNPLEPLDFAKLGKITFLAPDETRFPCLALAKQAGKQGGSMPTVLNGANEVLVWRFLNGEIGFMDIPRGVETILAKHQLIASPSLEEILAIDTWSREVAKQYQPKEKICMNC